MSNDEYVASQRERLAFDKANSARICRQACLNSALDFTRLVVGEQARRNQDPNALRDAVLITAGLFEGWIQAAKPANEAKEPVKEEREEVD